MIRETMTYIKNHIKAYLNDVAENFQVEVPDVELSAIERDNDAEKAGIFITLLHIEEETSMKQQTPSYSVSRSFTSPYACANSQPEMYINLYVMFSAQDRNYETALRNISFVIHALQSNSVISTGKGSDTLKLSLHQMTMDQNTNLWQTLGAKLMPSVIYKVRMLTVQASPVIPVKPVLSVEVKPLDGNDSLLCNPIEIQSLREAEAKEKEENKEQNNS